MEVSDPVTRKSRENVHDQLRRRVTSERPQSIQYEPEPSRDKGGRNESSSKKASANVSELFHDAFLVKAARSNEKQCHGLDGHEKLLFFEAVSKQWNAWQENAAATVKNPADEKVM